MAIIVNNLNGSKVDVSKDGNGNTVVVIDNISAHDEVKKSWDNLANPNSHESKMLSRAIRVSRRG